MARAIFWLKLKKKKEGSLACYINHMTLILFILVTVENFPLLLMSGSRDLATFSFTESLPMKICSLRACVLHLEFHLYWSFVWRYVLLEHRDIRIMTNQYNYPRLIVSILTSSCLGTDQCKMDWLVFFFFNVSFSFPEVKKRSQEMRDMKDSHCSLEVATSIITHA